MKKAHVLMIGALCVVFLAILITFIYIDKERDLVTPPVTEETKTWQVCDENGTIYQSEADAESAGLTRAQYGATYCDVHASYVSGTETVYAVYHLLDESVSFSHPGVGEVTLPVARSGSGARYANADERIVFWEHQNELTITKDDIEVFRGINTDTVEVGATMTEVDARRIAESSCVKGGEALGPGSYNPNSKTWWFDANLNSRPEGCSPACVVSEETKTAEINWRCTGLVPPVSE